MHTFINWNQDQIKAEGPCIIHHNKLDFYRRIRVFLLNLLKHGKQEKWVSRIKEISFFHSVIFLIFVFSKKINTAKKAEFFTRAWYQWLKSSNYFLRWNLSSLLCIILDQKKGTKEKSLLIHFFHIAFKNLESKAASESMTGWWLLDPKI